MTTQFDSRGRRAVLICLSATALTLAMLGAVHGAGQDSGATTSTKQSSDTTAPDSVSFSDEYLNDAANIKAGEALWQGQCRHCHGKAAYPGKAPKLKPRRYTPNFVFDRVTNGFRKMPSWKDVYDQDQRKAVVAYILSGEFSP